MCFGQRASAVKLPLSGLFVVAGKPVARRASLVFW